MFSELTPKSLLLVGHCLRKVFKTLCDLSIHSKFDLDLFQGHRYVRIVNCKLF